MQLLVIALIRLMLLLIVVELLVACLTISLNKVFFLSSKGFSLYPIYFHISDSNNVVNDAIFAHFKLFPLFHFRFVLEVTPFALVVGVHLRELIVKVYHLSYHWLLLHPYKLNVLNFCGYNNCAWLWIGVIVVSLTIMVKGVWLSS